MSRVRRLARLEMGEAINFEDVLTVMTVLLVLRLIFLVPLVNLDKAKTVAARSDAFWGREALWIHTHAGDDDKVRPYLSAFGLEGYKAVLSRRPDSRSPATAPGKARDILWIEAAAADSNLTVLRHDLASGRFSALQVNGRGHSRSFRHGTLLWSRSEAAWFAASDSVDYGSRAESKAMEEEFRAMTKALRGY